MPRRSKAGGDKVATVPLLRRAKLAAHRSLPVTAQLAIGRALMRLRLPNAGPFPVESFGGNVTVLGFLTSPTGLGEGARLCARSLADLGFKVGLIDITESWGLPGGVALFDGPEFVTGDQGGPLVCHANPPDFQQALYNHRMAIGGRKLIGYWAWELPKVPETWRPAFRMVHEVWVPSTFVSDALHDANCQAPIRVVPHPLLAPEAAPHSTTGNGSPLTILTVFAYESGFNRKNPLAAVDAFREAFGDRGDVRLVIKVRGKSTSGEQEEMLAAHVAEARNIEIVDRDLDHAGMLDLYLSADVLLSLHRAEGFGIPLATAMLMGKPVVATAWSGNLEFMDDNSACLVPATLIPAEDDTAAYQGISSSWAEPSIQEAANWLKRLEDPVLRSRVGEAARTHASKRLGLKAFADQVTGALTS